MSVEKEAKSFFQKFWHLLWKEDSFKGWLFSIVVLFVFIKFIFFPVLGLVTGTALPLAIVESCSMYHQGNLLSDFDSWFERHKEKYSESFSETTSIFFFSPSFSETFSFALPFDEYLHLGQLSFLFL